MPPAECGRGRRSPRRVLPGGGSGNGIFSHDGPAATSGQPRRARRAAGVSRPVLRPRSAPRLVASTGRLTPAARQWLGANRGSRRRILSGV